MQDSNAPDDNNVMPYKASGNLNTTIGNPRINVNDPMNVNIQSVNTNSSSSFCCLGDLFFFCINYPP